MNHLILCLMAHTLSICLRNKNPEGLILMSVGRALKGQAEEMVLHMGETVTLKDVIQRFDMLYGDVNPPEVLLAEFYAATQRNVESVTGWYTWFEDLASRKRSYNNFLR